MYKESDTYRLALAIGDEKREVVALWLLSDSPSLIYIEKRS